DREDLDRGLGQGLERSCTIHVPLSPCCSGTGGTISGSAAHAEAAVDGHDGAGDVGGRVAAQEGDDGGDLVGRAEPAHGDGGGQGLAALLGQRVGHGGGDGARLDDVDRDVAGGDLAGQRAAEAHEAGLGGGVVGLAGRPRRGDDRRDV